MPQNWFPPSAPIDEFVGPELENSSWKPPTRPIRFPNGEGEKPVLKESSTKPKEKITVPKFLEGGLLDPNVSGMEKLSNVFTGGKKTDSSGRPIVTGLDQSALPEWKSEPETYWGGFGKSLYNDFLRPMATPEGMIGSSMPGENILRPKELPPGKFYGGPSGGSGRVAIGEDLLDKAGTAEIMGNSHNIPFKSKPPIDLPPSSYSVAPLENPRPSGPWDMNISTAMPPQEPGMSPLRQNELLDRFGGREEVEFPIEEISPNTTLYRGGYKDYPDNWEGDPWRNYTTDKSHAEYFAKERNEPLYSLDIPTNKLEDYRNPDLPNDYDFNNWSSGLLPPKTGPAIYKIPRQLSQTAKEIQVPEPQALDAIEAVPSNTIPLDEPFSADTSNVIGGISTPEEIPVQQPEIPPEALNTISSIQEPIEQPGLGTMTNNAEGSTLSEPGALDRMNAMSDEEFLNSVRKPTPPPEEPFNPDTLFPPKPTEAEILESKNRASDMKFDLQGKQRTGKKFNAPSMDRGGRFPDEATDVNDAMARKLNIRFPEESGAMNISGEGSGIVPDIKNSRFGQAISQAYEEAGGGITGAADVTGNMMKSAMSTGDLSAPLRQGAALIHKKEFREALPKMLEMFNDEKVFVSAMEDIKNHPLFKNAVDNGLELTGLSAGKEERFLNTAIEEIPGYGRAVRASDRAYTGFLNKLRFDTYNGLLEDATKAGLKPGRNKDLAKEIAQFVNEATGRGGLGDKGERAASLLNSVFYSPRLLSSRVRMINRVVNPYMYATQSAFVRKEALKSALSLASFNMTVNGLAAAAGAKVTYDITNSDFMKNKVGNTRVDLGAGFLQPIVFASRLISGKYTSSTSNKTSKLGTGYGQMSERDLIWNFLKSKEAPLIGLASDIWTGKDFQGQQKNRAGAIAERFVPMILGDLKDIINDDPSLAPLILPGILGASVQTYKRPPRKMQMSMPSMNP